MKVKEAIAILQTMNPEDDLLGNTCEEFVDVVSIEASDPPGMVWIGFGGEQL